MKTSIQVMFLVVVGVVSTAYAFYLEVRRGAEHDRFFRWLKTERKPDWDGLSRVDRFLPIRAVEILRRGRLADDAEFLARYRLTRHGTRFAFAMSVAGAAIGLLILGTVFLDWTF
jgi:preprotein translocase subunit Sss1